MSFDVHRMVNKSFIESQFNRCPLIWMFHSRTLNNKINRLHEGALNAYSNYKSLFFELLEIDKSFSIYHKNIDNLAFKTNNFFYVMYLLGDHSFIAFAKFSEKLTFLTS